MELVPAPGQSREQLKQIITVVNGKTDGRMDRGKVSSKAERLRATLKSGGDEGLMRTVR